MESETTYTAFVGDSVIATGHVKNVLSEVKTRVDRGENTLVFIFEDQTGRQVDFDLRGTFSEALSRVLPLPAKAGPGRPKLGVTSREVTLLPRHWEWLEQQPNGASAALRRLVDEARHREPDKQRSRLVVEATGRFLSAMAGNFPGYEEATRALYAGDRERFEDLIREWPHDIREHAKRLLE